MIARFKGAIDWIRSQTYVAREQESLWQRVVRGENAKLEFPALKIEGSEHIEIGRNTSIGRNAWLACYDRFQEQQFQPRLEIGSNVRIGNYACITAIGRITIGDGCLISDYVYVSDHGHALSTVPGKPLVEQPLEFKGNVEIGRDCFVGMRVTILPNVTIGDGCVVGAHSVVSRSFPDRSMIAGNPAQLVQKL